MQKYHNFWRPVNFADMLEILQVLQNAYLGDFSKKSKRPMPCNMFTVSENMRAQDTWFL
jgi:hypothetical protein